MNPITMYFLLQTLIICSKENIKIYTGEIYEIIVIIY